MLPAWLALCDGNPPVTVVSLHKGSVIRCFHVLFLVRLDEQLTKVSGCQKFETPSRSCGVNIMYSHVFFLVILNKNLTKQSGRRRFETPRRQCNTCARFAVCFVTCGLGKFPHTYFIPVLQDYYIRSHCPIDGEAILKHIAWIMNCKSSSHLYKICIFQCIDKKVTFPMPHKYLTNTKKYNISDLCEILRDQRFKIT